MASLGRVQLTAPGATCGSGAAFWLNKPSPSDHIETVDDGWTIELSRGSKAIVVRGGAATRYVPAWKEALTAAQCALDMLSIKGWVDLEIVEADDEHIAWWTEGDGIALRAWSTVTLSVDVSPVTVTVFDRSGKEVIEPAAPAPKWHPSFRYFRLSQTTEDIFDAYRNQYLALEGSLNDIAPIVLRPNGKPGEPEGKWFKRALKAAGGTVKLAQFTPPATADPVEYLYRELYENTRTALFHAKQAGAVLLPHESADRAVVLNSLRTLTRLHLALTDAHFGVRRHGGGMAADAFRGVVANLAKSALVCVTDDESPIRRGDTTVSPAGRPVCYLTTRREVASERDFRGVFIGAAPAAELSQLKDVRRVALARADGSAPTAYSIDESLSLTGLARFEAAIGLQARNVRQPRTEYAT